MMATHGVLRAYRLHGTKGFVLSATGLLVFLAPIPALGPMWSAHPAVAADSNVRSHGDSPDPLQGSPPSSASVPEQIAALKKEQLELAQAIVAEFPNREEALVLIGNVLQFQARAEEADEFWKRALRINPQRADIYQSFGQGAMLRGDYEEAVPHWRQALEIDPQLPGARANLALALMGLGRHQEAVEALERGLPAGTVSSFDHFVLAQAYFQLGQLEKAKANQEAAIRLQPDYANAHYGLFTVYSRLGERSKAQEHLALFKQLKAREMEILKDRNDAHSDLQEVRGHVAETYVAACPLYADPQYAAKVEAMLRRAVEIDSSHVEALGRLGDFYQAGGRGTEAEAAYHALIKAAPARSDGYRKLAWLYLCARIGLPQARQLAEQAVALEPLALNYFVLSRAYDQNGDPARALSALKQATDLEPANPLYQQMYERMRARESKQ